MAKRNSVGRSEDEKRHDRTLAMMLHLQDFTYKEIAAIIERETGRSISFRQVGHDINWVRDQWKEERLDNYQEYIHEELARLDSMEMELWNSWRESKRDIVKERVEQVIADAVKDNDGKFDAEMITSKVITTTEASPGDTKYLDLILKVQQERRKLLGLYAPAKLDIKEEHVLNIKGYYGVSPDDWPESGNNGTPQIEDGNTVEGEFTNV